MGIAKGIIKKSIEEGIDYFIPLLEYRNTPVPRLGFSPAQILMSRRCRSKLPIKSELLIPKVIEGVQLKLHENNANTAAYYNRNTHRRGNLGLGDRIVVKRGKTWEPAKITKHADTPRSFIIQTDNESELRRNTIHLRKSTVSPQETVTDTDDLNNSHESTKEAETNTAMAGSSKEKVGGENNKTEKSPPSNVKYSRYGRQIKPPDRLKF